MKASRWILGGGLAALAASASAQEGPPGPSDAAGDGSSLADRIDPSTLLYVSVDVAALERGMNGLGAAQLLANEGVRAALQPVLEGTPLGERSFLELWQGLGLSQFVTGRVEVAVQGINLRIDDERLTIDAAHPIDARLLHRLIGLGSQVWAAEQRGGEGMPKIAIEPMFVLRAEAGPQWQALLQSPQFSDFEEAMLGEYPARHYRLVLDPELPFYTLDLWSLEHDGVQWLGGDPDQLLSAIGGVIQRPLSSSQAFASGRSATSSRPAAVFLHASFHRTLDVLGPLLPPILSQESEALGASAIDGLTLATSFVSGGVRDSIALTLREPPTGLLSLMRCPEGPFDLLEKAPAGTSFAAAMKFDPRLPTARTQQVLGAVFPGLEQAFAGSLDQLRSDSGVDLVRIGEALGGEWSLHLSTPVGGLIPDGVLWLDIAQRAAADELLALLLGLAEASGTSISPLRVKAPNGVGHVLSKAGLPLMPGVGITDDVAALAANSMTLRRSLDAWYAEQAPTRLFAAPRFTAVVEGLTGDGGAHGLGALCFVDLPALVPMVIGLLPLMTPEGAPSPDLAKLPPPLAIAERLVGFGLGLRSDDRAVSGTMFSPLGVLGLGMLAQWSQLPPPEVPETGPEGTGSRPEDG